MINIAICDDEQELCTNLKSILTDIFEKQKTRADIQLFLSGEELCNKIETDEHFDLIFLDILFAKNEINGVEIGRVIRNKFNNNTVQLVYISWDKSYSMQLFEVRPMDFLIKPLEIPQVEGVVETYLRITGQNLGVFSFKKGHDTFSVTIKDIIYMENNKRKIIIYLADGTQEEFYGSLKEVYKSQLKNLDFLFTHASFVVNYDYITAIKHNQLLVTGGLNAVPIAPNKSMEIKKKYLSIVKKRRGVIRL